MGSAPSKARPRTEPQPAPKRQPSYDFRGAPGFHTGTRLTMQQLSEWEAKRQRILTQLSQRSKWDEKGASALKQALADVKLLDAEWLADLAERGGILPRFQDVPAEAVVTLEEMERWDVKDASFDAPTNNLAVLVISAPDLDADHPDRDGLQLRKLAFVLKAFVRAAREYGGAKVGVMWEVCSVPKLKLEGRDEVLAMRQSDGGAGRTAAGGKCRLPCLRTAPHRPPWTIWRPRPRLRTPERRLSRLEAYRRLRRPARPPQS